MSSAGALRAAEKIKPFAEGIGLSVLAEMIDQETGAPELLAFAKAYVADLEARVTALGWQTAEQYFEHCESTEPYPMARAAIAKAEGDPS